MSPLKIVTIIKKEHAACTLAGTAGMNKYLRHVSHEYSCCVDQLAAVAGTPLGLLVSCSDLTN